MHADDFLFACDVRPLPLGRSSFPTLRLKNEIYVDKTKAVFELCRCDSKIFLSRPRRFGKSLLTSTFESLFKFGLRDFSGLAIEKLWTDHCYAVLHLDFSMAKDFTTVAEFEGLFGEMLTRAFRQAGLADPDPAGKPEARLASVLSQLPGSSLVLLIDEYDAPMTAHLTQQALFDEIQKKLSQFYASIKSYEGCLRFFFMTGITKLTHTGIFSAFNNLQDISLDPVFGALLGYTEKEVRQSFSPYLDRAAKLLELSEEKVFEEMQRHYNGFCFDETASTSVFCPWSVLNFLNAPHRGFKDYWYQSAGQPSALMQHLCSHVLDDPAQYGQPRVLSLDELSASQPIQSLSLDSLLVQTGYLTIKSILSPGFVEVGYPNEEVSRAMARLFADELLRHVDRMAIGLPHVAPTLAAGSLDEICALFNKTFNAIDYQGYPVKDEASCRALLQVYLIGAAMMPSVETHTARGRSDLEVTAGMRRWVFEIKAARNAADVPKLLAEGVRQMADRRYGETPQGAALRRAVLVFSIEERRFAAWKELKELPAK